MDFLEEVPLNISVVLNTHENSPVFKDTLDSVRSNLTEDVLVVVDAFGWKGFEGQDLPAHVLQGFHHGKPAAPHRNMALGLMQAWQIWGKKADWYCYMEYDCLVAGDVKEDLKSLSGHWIVGNDHRVLNVRIPFIDNFVKSEHRINYLLGCCLFFNVDFMKRLAEVDFFTRFLHYTNFFIGEPEMVDERGKKHTVYDISEQLYPTLAVALGGSVGELACLDPQRGRAGRYPMRFKPDMSEGEISDSARVIHPLKQMAGVREKYKSTRNKS